MTLLRKMLATFILLAVLGWVAAADATTKDSGQQSRPKIGLVLGGGGAKGAAHIGVLKVLEEQKIPIDYIAGTSMGAIVGALYASGLSADELEKVLTSIDWDDIFSGDPERKDVDWRRKREDFQFLTKLELGVKGGKILLPKGIIKDQKVNFLFETIMLHTSKIDDFDKLPIPFRAVATDLETGEMVVMKSGRLADAARASMSVPGVFPPAEINDRFLIDGGIVRNLPVDVVRKMGADIVIAIDVGTPLANREELQNALSIMNQMLDIMMKKNVQEQIDSLRPVDIYINPDLGDITSGDFARGKEAAATGEKAARQKIDVLKQYATSEQEYAAFLARHHRDLVTSVKVASVNIEIKGDTPIPPELIASRLSIKPGDTVDVETMKHDFDRVYGLKDYERVDLRLTPDGSEYDLKVKATEKFWGPNYLRMGMSLSSDFKGDSTYTILADYTRRWINQLGAEWKTQVQVGNQNSIYSEFWQPLDRTRLFFVMPHAEWRQNPYDVWINNTREARYRITWYDAGLDAGIQLSVYGEAAVGIVTGKVRADAITGQVDLPETKTQIGAITGRVLIDQMDNPNFPNKGYWGRLTLFSSMKQLGAGDAYNNLEGIVGAAYTYKKQTFLVSLDAGSHIGQQLPFYATFPLGGFLKLSGLSQDQLHGQQITLAKIVTYHNMAKSFFGDFYLGGSLETGNVWQADEKFSFSKLRLAGSLFVGYDTILGPLYLAYGHADGGFNAGYLYLGRIF